MVRAISVIGKVAYILGYPIIFHVLHNSHRTRVIIEYAGEILVVKHTLSMGEWGLPGGGLNRHESSDDAAKREIFEELMIDLSEKSLVYVSSEAAKQGLARFHLDFYYVRLETRPKINKQIHEILDFSWVKSQNINSLKMDQTDLSVVAAYFE